MNFGTVDIADRVLVIAEIGNNHLGQLDLAHKTLEAAAEAGVDAVKFQLYRPQRIITASAPVLAHVPNNTFKTQRERFAHMVLSDDGFAELARHAQDLGVMFMCTPFDEESADFLDPLVPAFKMASGDSSNFRLIDYVSAKGKPMIVSTGLCDQDEVDALVARLPADRSMILHCIGSYPTPDDEANLDLIPFFAGRYPIPVGYSDHTPDTLAPFAAVALGARAIEKHFILDRALPGGDRALSLTGPETKAMVEGIRRLERMISGGTPRRVRMCEVYGKRNLRRSPYTARPVSAGEHLGPDDIIFLRPEEPGALTLVQSAKGVVARCDMAAETLLTPDNVTTEG